MSGTGNIAFEDGMMQASFLRTSDQGIAQESGLGLHPFRMQRGRGCTAGQFLYLPIRAATPGL